MRSKYALFIVISALSLVADQATKIWIRGKIPVGGRPIDVIDGYARLIHAENPGAAWSILAEASWRIPFFVVTTTIALVGILYYHHKLDPRERLQTIAMGLIMGGALGNFIDRITYHSVTDFIQVYWSGEPVRSWLISVFGSNQWPTFNVADSTLAVGIGFMLYHTLVIEPRQTQAAAPVPEAAPGSP